MKQYLIGALIGIAIGLGSAYLIGKHLEAKDRGDSPARATRLHRNDGNRKDPPSRKSRNRSRKSRAEAPSDNRLPGSGEPSSDTAGSDTPGVIEAPNPFTSLPSST